MPLPRPQLVRFRLTECQLEAVAAIPWQAVLPRLPALRDLSIERCHGAALLGSLWAGLAAASSIHRLRITGQSSGGGLPAERLLQLVPAMQGWQAGQAQHQDVAVWGIPVSAAPAAPPALTIPDCVALMQQLRCLDLGGNGLHALPDSLAWCQQLTAVHLRGNRLETVGQLHPVWGAYVGVGAVGVGNGDGSGKCGL